MINDYKCDNKDCGKITEYITGISFNEPIPEICPDCGKGKLEKLVSFKGITFDIHGYCYTNVYGRKNWKKNKSVEEVASYYIKDDNGQYKQPY